MVNTTVVPATAALMRRLTDERVDPLSSVQRRLLQDDMAPIWAIRLRDLVATAQVVDCDLRMRDLRLPLLMSQTRPVLPAGLVA